MAVIIGPARTDPRRAPSEGNLGRLYFYIQQQLILYAALIVLLTRRFTRKTTRFRVKMTIKLFIDLLRGTI